MTRIINLDGVGKQRKRLTREVVLAVRELVRQGEVTDETKDLAAFIAMNLQAIYETIDLTVAAWEKRDYWVKADRFRLEWAWSGKLAEQMREAIKNEDWQTIALTSAEAGQKLHKVQVPKRHKMGEPWHGAWAEYNKSLDD
ncbi:MAG: hypothetical protein JSV69_15695 [Chloroflexota bacterium]|nr:MAG: hypothetical protein JSV69_15695 [Chloroflexota bacterium]